MKKIEILGLSVVTAALIMTGCSSDDDTTPAASGPTAPGDVTQSVEMDISTAQNAVAMTANGVNIFAASPKLAAIKADVKAKVAALKDSSSSDNGSWTEDCALSGSYTNTWSWTQTNKDDGSWSVESTNTDTYNDCLSQNNATGSNGEPMNIYAQRGSATYTWTDEYNSDGQLSKYTESENDNYSWGYENNETSTSQVWSNAYTYNYTSEQAGIVLTAVDPGGYKETDAFKGDGSWTETNSSGSVYNGDYWEGDLSYTSEGMQDGSYGKETVNGFYADYDVNATGRTLTDSEYFKNYVFEFTEMGDESNISINGTRGHTCLGGSVTFATNPILQENTVDYLDGDNLPGDNVLPYAGVMTVSGTGTATLTFDNNTTHSDVNVSSGETSEVFTRFSDLAVGACN